MKPKIGQKIRYIDTKEVVTVINDQKDSSGFYACIDANNRTCFIGDEDLELVPVPGIDWDAIQQEWKNKWLTDTIEMPDGTFNWFKEQVNKYL